MNGIISKFQSIVTFSILFAVIGYGGTVKIPRNTVTTQIQLIAGKGEIPIQLRWSDGFVKNIKIRPFDASLRVGRKLRGGNTLFKNIGFEFKGLNIKAFVRPNPMVYNNKLRAKYSAEYDKQPEIYGAEFTLSARQDDTGVEFLINGNHAGRVDHAGRLSEITSPLDKSRITFDQTKVDPRYVQLDIGYLNNPGTMKGASVKLIDKSVPFIQPNSANLDLGVTASHKDLYSNSYRESGYTGRNAYDKARDSYLFTVPRLQYARAWVLCAAEEAPSKTPAFNVRLTRFVPSQFCGGRAREAIADTTVTIPGENAVKVGEVKIAGKTLPLWRVEAILKTGQILDLITDPGPRFPNPYTVPRGISSNKYGRGGLFFGPYLDFELTGKLYEQRDGTTKFGDEHPSFEDHRMFPNPNTESSIHVFGVTLEKAGADLLLAQSSQPGNIFYNDETPEMKATVIPTIPGEYKLIWTIRDHDGKKVGGGEARTSTKKEFTIDLKQKHHGWYELIFELCDSRRVLIKHRASFALLGKDTRKAGFDSPYGTTWFGYTHYGEGNIEIMGPLLMKAGFRRTTGLDTRNKNKNRARLKKYIKWNGPKNKTEKDYAKWKLSPHNAIITRKVTMTDEEMKEKIADMAKRFPHANLALGLYESSGISVAPELIGKKPGKPRAKAIENLECIKQLYRVVRANFPDMKIVLGNTLASTKVVAEVMRGDIPKDSFDYFGIEAIGQTSLPERQWENSLQGAELMRETGCILGYPKPVTSCSEVNYRLDELIGEDKQAHWYARDILLMHAYRFPHINLAIISDAGNCYQGSWWGNAGITRRAPYLYPKKSFVAISTITRVLDQVELIQQIPTGSRSVYTLEFKRADGKIVYALWTSRGTAELTLQLGSNNCERVSFYGVSSKPSLKDKKLTITASVAPQYLITDSKIKNITLGKRTYPDDNRVPGFQVVDPVDDPLKWELEKQPNPLLERTSGSYTPYRTLAKATLKGVNDPEKGKCLEISFDSNLNMPNLINEYAVIKLKKPVLLKGNPHTVGLWVKGNSGWGQIYWEIEDVDGKKMISCGARDSVGLSSGHPTDIFDYDGRVSINFDGWNFLSLPITSRSPIPDLTSGCVPNLWNPAAENIKYPIKLTGLVFSAPPKPLFLANRHPHKQVIRLKDVSVIFPSDTIKNVKGSH